MSMLRRFGFAVLLSSMAGAAVAEPADVVGHWIYDQHGARIGSVRSLSSDGRTAHVLIGSYFQEGSHAAQVPVSALTVVDGKVMIQPTTVQALNAPGR